MRQGHRQGPCTIAVDVPPEDVDAGADVKLKVRVTGLRKDAKRAVVLIRDLDGAELAKVELTRAELTAAGGAEHLWGDVALAVPRSAGERVWRAVAIAADRHGALCEEASAEFHLTVRPHALDLVVWDVPSAIVAGERFRFKVGSRCSSTCCMGGQSSSVTDGQGRKIAAASFAGAPWPGTEALYAAEVQALAPETAGDHEWQIAVVARDLALPHAAGKARMQLNVVPPADCLVRIEVLDAEKRTPVAAARVVMHPYRATTNAAGIASLRVTKGRYDVLVAGSKYTPIRIPIDVCADVDTQATVVPEPSLESLDEA